jgi:predicted small integral membrane protein
VLDEILGTLQKKHTAWKVNIRTLDTNYPQSTMTFGKFKHEWVESISYMMIVIGVRATMLTVYRKFFGCYILI